MNYDLANMLNILHNETPDDTILRSMIADAYEECGDITKAMFYRWMIENGTHSFIHQIAPNAPVCWLCKEDMEKDEQLSKSFERSRFIPRNLLHKMGVKVNKSAKYEFTFFLGRTYSNNIKTTPAQEAEDALYGAWLSDTFNKAIKSE